RGDPPRARRTIAVALRRGALRGARSSVPFRSRGGGGGVRARVDAPGSSRDPGALAPRDGGDGHRVPRLAGAAELERGREGQDAPRGRSGGTSPLPSPGPVARASRSGLATGAGGEGGAGSDRDGGRGRAHPSGIGSALPR